MFPLDVVNTQLAPLNPFGIVSIYKKKGPRVNDPLVDLSLWMDGHFHTVEDRRYFLDFTLLSTESSVRINSFLSQHSFTDFNL